MNGTKSGRKHLPYTYTCVRSHPPRQLHNEHVYNFVLDAPKFGYDISDLIIVLSEAIEIEAPHLRTGGAYRYSVCSFAEGQHGRLA